MPTVDLSFPSHLSPDRRALLTSVAERVDREHGDNFLGLVLSGSAGRGIATERSDVDVYVVLDTVPDGYVKSKSPTIDEIPTPLADLTYMDPFGTGGWWYRWSCAWAPVLLDRTGGELADAVRRSALVSDEEADAILIEHDRLEGWINYAFRALKSDQDGRELERRLDAVESVPWLLDTIFTFAGRVRPYHKYLPWELREHPVDGWPAELLLPLLTRTVDGEPAALRETFALVVADCVRHDLRRGNRRMMDIVDGWGDELAYFESPTAS
ncbi:nucleotidyltransferase domain-containing protein [Nocardioides sp.]|uniref:nucleotidyltransferase domain-containing protein n=1 Tax=Nocardioides sp. TaxID=35761 RepID=UPI002CEAC3D5|nr:nucleotidyltransferase domain-containing protein [Nocardioides sp.]HXH77793.1 nucleotidyltransferase domain-containing protein [Nocardioides sp.]